MIDNPDQVERLVVKLRECLPLPAAATPGLSKILRERARGKDVLRRCQVVRVDYAGDEGGIMCKLAFGSENDLGALFVSITHLAFDRTSPMAREIAAYQKHRAKRLRRLGAAMALGG